MLRKILLVCGIASSLLYAAMTIWIAALWDGYSSASRVISELSAIDAPTRSVWMVPGAMYTLLIVAFGWGVWRCGVSNRRLRTVGALILSYGALGLLWPFAPMHMRETLAAGGGTFSDTLHLILSAVTVALMLAAMSVGALAFGRGFRVYSFVSLAVLGVFGVLTFVEAPGVGANLPTPWIGVWERINLGTFLLWIIVLALALWPAYTDARWWRAAHSTHSSVG